MGGHDDAQLPLLGGYEVTFSARRFVRFFGPGLILAIAYVDPGNLESDLQLGAAAGFSLLWVLLLTTALGYVIQMQAAKFGVVTGQDLAEHIAGHFGLHMRLFLWMMAEVAIVGSDVQEVIGSAIALRLLTRGALPLWAGVALSAVASFLLLLVERLGIAVLEGVFGALIAIMVGSFAVCFRRADVPLGEVARGFLTPWVPKENVGQAVALVGSLIMPHNIYLHSSLVQTRKLRRDDDAHKREALVYYGIESAFSLALSIVINTFVVCVFAAGFYGTAAAADIGLENAGEYLGGEYGPALVIIFALGLLAAGCSATMTGAFTGQFVMQGFLRVKWPLWRRVLVTRAVALVPALIVALAANATSSSTGLDRLNQCLNLLQAVQLPFALIPLLVLNASPRLLGRRFANGRGVVCLTVAIALAVMCVNISGVLAFLEGALAGAPAGAWALVAALVAAYCCAVMAVFVSTASAAGLLLPAGGSTWSSISSDDSSDSGRGDNANGDGARVVAAAAELLEDGGGGGGGIDEEAGQQQQQQRQLAQPLLAAGAGG